MRRERDAVGRPFGSVSPEGRVEFCQVRLEAHKHGATIYVVGLLADLAAARTVTLIAHVAVGTSVIRMDLRGVHLIDPRAFVRIARSLNEWRDLRGGRVSIEFPERSSRRTSTRPQLVWSNGVAVPRHAYPVCPAAPSSVAR